MIGEPAAAVVEGEHPAPMLRIADERRREGVEIRAGARQSRQAHDRQARCGALAVFAQVQPQAVARRDEVVTVAAGCHAVSNTHNARAETGGGIC